MCRRFITPPWRAYTVQSMPRVYFKLMFVSQLLISDLTTGRLCLNSRSRLPVSFDIAVRISGPLAFRHYGAYERQVMVQKCAIRDRVILILFSCCVKSVCSRRPKSRSSSHFPGANLRGKGSFFYYEVNGAVKGSQCMLVCATVPKW